MDGNYEWISHFVTLFTLFKPARSNLIPSPPTYNSKYGYLNWEAYYNTTYYTRLLPPVPEDCPTPMGVTGKVYSTAIKLHICRHRSPLSRPHTGLTANRWGLL